MSEYHVSKIAIAQSESNHFIKFDNKEDAEHYAKNQSVSDDQHRYVIQKNDKGDFATIKTYLNGQVV